MHHIKTLVCKKEITPIGIDRYIPGIKDVAIKGQSETGLAIIQVIAQLLYLK